MNLGDRAVTRQSLLLEIGTEELPPKALLSLAQAFASGVKDRLSEAGLEFAALTYYATPRRLAVMVSELESEQKDKMVRRRGPSLSVAYDATGQPTSAALGFARSCRAILSDLEHEETDKGNWLSYLGKEKGQATVMLVPHIVESALLGLPIPKKMRWGSASFEFVRPVHWFVALFGSLLIDCSVLGIRSTRQSFGHRFCSEGAITLQSATDYVLQLQQAGKVIVDFDQRKELIRTAVNKTADEAGGKALLSDDLLNEVTALVEWPVAILGNFDKRFLTLPREVLIATMQDHQRYFPLVDYDAALLPCFVSIINIESKSPQRVRLGNERVILPRLSDAEFFWQQDIQSSLADFRPRLKDVIFQQKLGSLYDKSERLISLITKVADDCAVDKSLLRRAAFLSKCDLLTQMVNELPKLQGMMGRYYAIHDGENEAVALALAEQYMPCFAGDAVATSSIGQLLSIADKLDTLVGIFAIGQVPTGDKDPFALRRIALGVLRTIIESKLPLDIWDCLHYALDNYPLALIGNRQKKDGLLVQIFDFLMDRLRSYYIERATPIDNFMAVLACKPTRPYDFELRLCAVAEFMKLPQAESLIAANKRVANMLKLHGGDDKVEFIEALLQEDAERQFAAELAISRKRVSALLDDKAYTTALTELAELKCYIDAFFDNVMVICDDLDLRNNRLTLLKQWQALFFTIADVSKLQ